MKTIKIGIMYILVLSVLVMAGCATTGTTTSNIPPEKLFNKIKVGMSQSQMVDLIGYWSDIEVKVNPANFIPLVGIFAEHTYTITYYKGNGRVYLKNDRIEKIEYDPSEDGYK